jgi:hypothetical protein
MLKAIAAVLLPVLLKLLRMRSMELKVTFTFNK